MTEHTYQTELLKNAFPEIYSINEPLAKHSTFRIGGNAAIALFPRDEAELIRCIKKCRETGIRYEVIGNGSNILFADAGYDGAILFTTGLKEIQPDGVNSFTAGAGALLTTLCLAAEKHCLHGLEFAYGIPGTVGGAVFMNAGAYGGEMKDVVRLVRFYDAVHDRIETVDAAAAAFGYRTSVFQDAEKNGVILSATVALVPGEQENISGRMRENMTARKEKQPLDYPSAGSAFKRYPGYFTAQLIDRAGLRGCQIGGAQVSEKHAGFIINRGGATADDVSRLVQRIQEKIFEQNGIHIECEIRFVR